MVGLFIGRFQPLHKGHLLMMQKLAGKVETLVVGLGSVHVPLSCKNPFTTPERVQMIQKGMKEIGITHYEIVEIPDDPDDTQWVTHVQKAAGTFDIAWSGDPWVIRVFKAHHLSVKTIKEFSGCSATKIRRRMAQGLPWLKYVPLSVRKYLREIGAAKRVRELCGGA